MHAPAWPYAEVAVDVPVAPATRGGHGQVVTFTYGIPATLVATLAPGHLVSVPFGRRQLQGIVVALRHRTPVERTRDVLALIDARPALSIDQLALARWMSAHYLAPLFECLRAMLPPGALPRGDGAGGTRPRTERVVRLVIDDPDERTARLDALLAGAKRRARQGDSARHAAVIEALLAGGGVAVWGELRRSLGVTPRVLAALESAGLIVTGDRAVWRDPLGGRAVAEEPVPELTADQARAWARIAPLLDPRGDLTGPGAAPGPGRARVCLLHGVTGSGKTELYLRAIGAVLATGRQAIVLVPEIALTPQTVARFAGRFPGRVGVWHSDLSPLERRDTWLQARDGRLDIIVGSRSAVFAPLPALGLIVIDEEHADAFKQGNTPRYHARDVAVRRAAITRATVLMGSATPDVVTYWAARAGSIRLVELPRRVVAAGGHTLWAELPPVTVVDMRAELRAGNASIFSRALHGALHDVLAGGEQAILFLNRRGSATFVSCRDCGHVQSCPRCRLPLVWHGARGALVCHHCNHREAPPMMCPGCGGVRIRYFGAGTQRVEDEVHARFPDARVIRWDADTTGARGAHEAILARFASGGADVLVGTQMLTKGLDLPRVTLVGIVSADTMLNLPDIWARERTFQLLAQVAGRAGRSTRGGQVVLQTYRPDDPVIARAARHDYGGFFADEIAYRGEHRYPPFARLVNLEHVTAGGDHAAEREASRLAEALRAGVHRLGLPDTDVIGPAPAFFRWERGRARWHVVVRSRDPYALLEHVTLGPGWRVDVDPVSLL